MPTVTKTYYHNIDLDNNQLLNAVIENRDTAPVSPVDGQIYYNTVDKKIYHYNSTTSLWVEVGGSAATLYTSNGTLLGNRIVTVDDKQLVFRSNASTLQNYTFTIGTPTGVPPSTWPSSVVFEGEYLMSTANAEPYNTRVWGRNQTSGTRSLWVNQSFADITGESTGATNIYNQLFATRRGSLTDTSTTATPVMRGVWSEIGHRYITNGTPATIVTTNQEAFYAQNLNFTGNITNVVGYYAQNQVGSGISPFTTNITNYYGFYQLSYVVNSKSTVTNHYGIFLDVPIIGSGGVITNRWGIYAPDALSDHYFNGNVLLGTTTDTGLYKLDVNGTARVVGELTVGTSASVGYQTWINGTTSTRYTSGQKFIVTYPFGIVSFGSNNAVPSPASGNKIGFQITNRNAQTLTFYEVDDNNSQLFISANSTNTGSASAIAEFQSTTQGFLQPRMTTTERNAITSPATGLQVYNTTGNTLDYYNGTAWTSVGNVSGSGVAGQVAYWNGTTSQTGSNNLFWDAANSRLGIGIATPQYQLHILKTGNGTLPLVIEQNNVSFNTGIGFRATNGGIYSRFGITAGSTPDALISGEGGMGIAFQTGGTTKQYITSSGNVILQNGGTFSDGGQRLQVSGTTFSTTGFEFGVGMFLRATASNHATMRFGTNGSNLLGAYGTGIENSIFLFSYPASNTTSAGDNSIWGLTHTFNPTSGSSGYIMMGLRPTINQVGATGITRGLYVNPILTAAADFRAIETSAGNVLFGSNFFWDNTNVRLGIGTNTPTTLLNVRGDYAGSLDNSIPQLLFENANSTASANLSAIVRTRISTGYLGGFPEIWIDTTRDASNNGFTRIRTVSNHPLSFWTNDAERVRLFSGGNLLIQSGGTYTDGGQRLQVSGDVFIKGSGSTLDSTGLTVQNNAGTSLMVVRNDGNVAIGGAATAGYKLRIYGTLWANGIGQLSSLEGSSGVGSITFYDQGTLTMNLYGTHASEAVKGFFTLRSQDVGYTTTTSTLLHADADFADHPTMIIRSRNGAADSIFFTNYHYTLGALFSTLQPVGGNSDITFRPNRTNKLVISATGTYAASVLGDALITGSGTTSATTALTVRNNASTNLFTVLNDGAATFVNTITSSASGFSLSQLGGNGIRMGNLIFNASGLSTTQGGSAGSFTWSSANFNFTLTGDLSVTGANGSAFRSNTSSTPAVFHAAGSTTVAIELMSNSLRRFRILADNVNTTFEASNQTGVFSFNNNVSITGNTFSTTFSTNGGILLNRNSDEAYILFQRDGSGVAQLRALNGGGFRITAAAATTEWARFHSTGNFGINTGTTDYGQRFQVIGDTLLSGTTNFTGAQLGIYGSTDKGQTVNSGSGGLFIGYYSTGDLSYASIPSVTIGRPNNRLLNSTSGTQIMGSVVGNYSPTSGTGQFITLEVVPTINQMGGANGVTRGLYINPTITAAADWRAIETTAGNIIFNGGNVGVGTASPSARLHIVGTGTTNATTSFVSQNSANAVNGTIYNDGTWFFGGGNTRLAATAGQFDFNTAAGNIVKLGHWEVFLRPLQYTSSLELSTNIRLLGGNVLINTSTDTGLYKLDVNGTARVTGTMTVVKSGDAFVVNNESGLEKFKVTDNGVANNSYAFLRRTTNAGDMFQVFYPAGTISSTNPTWNFGMNANSADFVIAYWGGAAVKNSMIFKTTGQSRFVPLVSAPSGAEAGDVYYDSTLNALSVYNGSAWVALGSGGGGGSMSIGGAITSATAGSVLFAGTSGVLQQNNANFFWDNTNGRLGIGTNTPRTNKFLDILYNVPTAGGAGFGVRNSNASGYSELVFDNDTTPDASGAFVFGYGGTTTPYPNNAYFWNRRNAPILFGTNGLERIRITGAGRLLLGTITESSYLLDINGSARTKFATGYNNTTTDGGLVLTSSNDGNVALGVTTDLALRIKTNSIGAVFTSTDGQIWITGTRIYAFNSTGILINSNITDTTGTNGSLTVNNTVNYVNISHVYNAQTINPTITGLAGGVARGLYINPTLTAAADFRAIETTAGNVLFGASGTGFYWDNTNSVLGLGTSTPNVNSIFHANKSQNNLTSVFATNNSTGTAAHVGFRAGLDPTNFATDYISMFILGANWTTGSLLKPKTGVIENFGSNFLISNYNNSEPIVFATGTSRTERMRLTAAGRLLLGTTTEGSFLLDVNGTARVSGNTTFLGTIAGSNAGRFVIAAQNFAVNITSNNPTNGEGSLITTGAITTTDSQTKNVIEVNNAVTSTSASFNTLNGFAFTSTINQTLGTIRGLYIAPTLTASTDFRAIETTAGNVLFGSNFFWNNTNSRLGIGTNTPTAALQVVGGIIATNVGTPLVYSSGSDDLSLGTVGGTTGFTIKSASRNVMLYTGALPADSGQRLQVFGDVFIKGSGATSATNAMLVQNSAGTGLFYVRNDGYTEVIGQLKLNGIGLLGNVQLYPSNDGGYVTSPSGAALRYETSFNAGVSSPFAFTYNLFSAEANTAANITHTSIFGNFAPTSGTKVFQYLNISGTINQTGGANGITRGLYVNPTLTAAADWRSIETSNNAGWSYYGAGTANSYFGGRVGIGTNTPLDFNLVVQGSLQVRGSANSFTGLLIQQDFIRRRDTGTFSLGSNDVATAIHMYASNNVGIGTSSDAGYKFDVNGNARIGTTPFADTSSSLIIGGTGNAQRGSVTGPGNYQDFMFVNTNIASGNINTWSFGQRRDTFFGNQLGSFQIVGGYINNSGATSAVDGGYRVPLICNPNGDVIIAGASANAVNGDVAIGTATFGTATKVTIGGSEIAVSAIARGTLINTTLTAAANSDVLVGLDINPTFTNGAFTGVANWGIRNYSSIRFETPSGSSNQGLYWTPAQDATQVRVFASNYSVTGFNTLNAMSGQDGLVVNGNERKLTINAAASSIYLDTSNIIISSHGSGETMRIVSTTKNVLIGLTTDAGYKLDVNGEIRSSSRVLSGLGGLVNNCLYTYISNHCGSGGYIGFGFQNVTNPGTSDSVFDIYQGPVSSPIANLFNIKHALLNASVAQGQAILGITTTINQSATATGDIRGIHYNPTVTNIIGNHYAWESTSGKFKISDLSGSGTRMVVADSTGVLSTQAIPSGGSSAYTVVSVSTTYSETATSGTKIIKATTAGGTFVITLPTAVGNTATLIIKKTAGSADLTIDGAGTETIDGGLTAILRRVDESITLVSDNVNWLII